MKIHGIATAVAVSLALVGVGHTQNRPDSSGPALVVYAAGSLRAAILQVANEYQKRTGVRIGSNFGASGTLRERIEHGDRPDVFASADMTSPQRLAEENLGTPPRVFTANALCVIARPGLDVSPPKLLDVLLDPQIRIGTGEPVADPAGDYAEAVFANVDRLHPGAKAIMDKKAVRLIGAKDAPKVPAGQEGTSYFLLVGKQADVMLVYCSGAQEAVRASPALQLAQLPANLTVHATYGYTVITGSKPGAADFGRFLESDAAQEIFLKNGFMKK